MQNFAGRQDGGGPRSFRPPYRPQQPQKLDNLKAMVVSVGTVDSDTKEATAAQRASIADDADG